MRSPLFILISALGLTVALTHGCAGDGSALFDDVLEPDPDMCPPEDTAGAPTLAEVQAAIFGDVCSICHDASGIGPFRLDTEEESFQNLVGVPTACTLPDCEGLNLVEPCDVDRSYLIWKLEGMGPEGQQIEGDQMPLFFPPLSEGEIDLVRGWIEAGAQP